jgi:hypothetical protein
MALIDHNLINLNHLTWVARVVIDQCFRLPAFLSLVNVKKESEEEEDK